VFVCEFIPGIIFYPKCRYERQEVIGALVTHAGSGNAEEVDSALAVLSVGAINPLAKWKKWVWGRPHLHMGSRLPSPGFVRVFGGVLKLAICSLPLVPMWFQFQIRDDTT
jgi:hypothetical protein